MHKLDIPNLDLNGKAAAPSSSATSPIQTTFSSRGETPDPGDPDSQLGSRRTSFSSSGRQSSGSRSSSRSTSFSLPNESAERIRISPGERGEVEFDEEMDEESK